VAAGLSRAFGGRGSLRSDVTYRDYQDFYASRLDTSTGKVTDSAGQTFDLTLVENTNTVERRYVAWTTQASYRLGDRIQVNGHYTLSRLWGTVNGENVGAGPVTTGLTFPEYSDPAWNNPEGDLASDQRHRVVQYGTYRLPVSERLGTVTVSGVQRAWSGTPYGASGTVNTRPYVTNPGYQTPPATVTYFFTDRDAFRTETQVRTDFALNYAYRLPGGTRRELFAQLQLLNVFNQFQLIDVVGGNINTTVLTNASSGAPLQTFNPLTETPVEGVHWAKGPQFGQALGANAYTEQRKFQISLGVRF
jgi:hypothetical protein